MYLFAVYQQTQLENPARTPNKFDEAIFDIVDIRKYFLEIDGIRYPTDATDINYTESNPLDQYRVPKLFS